MYAWGIVLVAPIVPAPVKVTVLRVAPVPAVTPYVTVLDEVGATAALVAITAGRFVPPGTAVISPVPTGQVQI